MLCHQFMETTNAFQPLGQATTGQPLPSLVHHMDVMVGLRPIITNKDHPDLPSIDTAIPRASKGNPAAT
jgi:hypothetical protein